MASPGKLLVQSECTAVPARKRANLEQTVIAGERKGNRYLVCKRCLDLVLAGALLVLLSPLLLLIAILIKLDSPGPVLFTQERVGARRKRVGKNAVWVVRNFMIYKFRSMVANADSSVHERYVRDFIEGQAQSSPLQAGIFKITSDPRVTTTGRILRKFSLDELPQLFNVLRGEMSLVGPRPVPPYEVACYRDGHHRRLAAFPGITGLWQVKGRGRVPFEEMVRLDVEYIRNASIILDLKILLSTIPAVLSQRGAE